MVTGILGGCQKPDAAPEDGVFDMCVCGVRSVVSGCAEPGGEEEGTTKRQPNEQAVEIDLDQKTKTTIAILK